MDITTTEVHYLYFLDTNNLSELCPVNGHNNMTLFNILYDDTRTISVLYRPASLEGSTRSIIFLGSGYEQYKHPEAHIFYIQYNNLIDDFNNHPIMYSILLKFHELLNIAFCKIIGHDLNAYALLAFNALFEEIAPWTFTLLINPILNVSNLEFTFKLEDNLGKIKTKQEKGTHMFVIVQNRLDKMRYKDLFVSRKNLLSENRIQGWTFETPASTFYNNSQTERHLIRLDKNAIIEFIDHISTGVKNNSAIYKLFREF